MQWTLDSIKKRVTSSEGSILLIVTGIAALLLVSGLAFTSMAGNATYRVMRIRDHAQAQAIAEGGIADMIARMRTNYNMWVGATNAVTLAEGAFVVETELLTNGNVLITSVGTVGGVDVTTVVETLDANTDPRDTSWTFGEGLLADGIVVMETGAPEIDGDAHSNSLFDMDNGDITGNLTSADQVIVNHGTVSGATLDSDDGITSVEIPGFDFAAYRTEAQSGGLYYSSSQNFTGTVTPANGILFVDGDVTFSNRSVMNGVIVASGNIYIHNQLTQNQVAGWPAVLAQGLLELHNRNVYNGTVYGGTGITFRNNRTVNGSVISRGPVSIRNNLQVNSNASPPPWSPYDTGGVPDVVVGGWLE